MRKGLMLALMNPRDPADETAYHEWYERVHVPDVLKHPGFERAVRFRLSEEQLLEGQPDDPAPHRYLTVYVVDVDRMEEARAALPAIAAASEAFTSETVDGPGSRAWVYEEISGPFLPGAPARRGS